MPALRIVLLIAVAFSTCGMVGCGHGVKQMPKKQAERDGDDLFRLSEKVFHRLGEVGYERLTDAQKVFVCVWSLEGEVNNGGFDQFYFNSSGDWAVETPAALEKIGAHQAAAIVRKANSVFPDGKPSNDRELRQQQLDALPDAVRDSFQQIDSQFYKYPDNLESLLRTFVRDNIERL
jgi:hypothetical protein